MIEIYEIIPDSDKCRSLSISDVSFVNEGHLWFDGNSRLPDWNPPKFWVYNPLKIDSDFQNAAGGAITLSERLTKNDRVMEALELSGELLPIYLETGERFFILNVTACTNSLDQSKCKFSQYWDNDSKSMKKGGLEKYAFRSDRLSCSPIFKVPETAKAHVLTSRNTGRLHCESDFMTIYEEEKLTGLRFEKIWEGV